MRTFIAIEISGEIKKALARIESHLKYSDADVKWVEPASIHLTLKFLGDIDEKKAEEIQSALDNVAKVITPFEISVKDIGAFPDIDYPRVIWAGLDKGAKESTELAGKIDETLSKLGFAKETRPFAAHITIGRVRSAKNKQALGEKIASCSFQPSAISHQLILSIILFESTLTPTGSIYTKLHEAKFKMPGLV